MRFGVASEFACALSWWLRLQDEGHEVMVWIGPKEQKRVGDGLVNKAGTFEELLRWCRQEQSVLLFDSSGMGDRAEEARAQGIRVVGGGKFMDRLEKDRAYGFRIAEEAGCQLPPYEEFGSFDDCLAFAQDMDDTPVYFKSDRYLDSDATHGADSREELVEYLEHIIRTYGGHGKCILQQKLEGIAISTARWWNGADWCSPFETTIEHKKLMNDDKGPSTGCSINVVWFQAGETKLATALGWHNFGDIFRREKAPPGLYDINALVTEDGEAYFLEWTPRLGYDSEMTSGRLFPSLSENLYKAGYGGGEMQVSEDLALAIRLGVPPYPWEHSKKIDTKSCLGTYISGEVGDLWSGPFIAYELEAKDGRLEMASAEGIVGLSYAQGKSLEKLNKEAVEFTKELRGPSFLLRTDADRALGEDAKKIKAAGFEVHPDMIE